MKILSYLKKAQYKSITGAYIFGVTGIYTEPLYMGIYLFRKIFSGQLVKKKFILFFLILLAHGLVMGFFTGYSYGKMFQQVLLVFLVLYGYVQMFYKPHQSVEGWFGIYLNFTYIIAIFGLLQFIVRLFLGINIFPYTLDLRETQNALRLHSILIEAGHLASFFMPAVCYIIISKDFFRVNKAKSLTILTASVLTYSATMYIGIAIALIYKFYERIKRLKWVFYIVFVYSMWTLSNFDYGSKSDTTAATKAGYKSAYNKIIQSLDAVSVLMSKDTSPEYFESFNTSTYATMTNFWIALNAPYRIIGTGIGTHQQNYEAMYESDYRYYGLNKEGAYSLFARILSEFGYLGLCLYLFYVVKCYNRRNVLSTCFLIYIICILIKGGHYTMNCGMLFQLLYYQCAKRTVDESKIIVCLKNKK